ncbi:helix-turn-helix domain-containing protein [bacterium]|nr:helix-turn-helix domain-containing protein [bacterium]
MKVKSITSNNRKKGFEVKTTTLTFWFPYAMLENPPSKDDPIVHVGVDEEIEQEGFTYVLESGIEETVHVEQVLDYNKDPSYIRDTILYKLSLDAQEQVSCSLLSKREIIRRLGTSASQFYRLLDQTNYKKTIDQMLVLLNILGCDIDVVVKAKCA